MRLGQRLLPDLVRLAEPLGICSFEVTVTEKAKVVVFLM